MPNARDISLVGLILAIFCLAFLALVASSGGTIGGHTPYEIAKDQGGLLSGFLALFAGLLAYRAGQSQVAAATEQNRATNFARLGREKAARTLLSKALVEVMDHSHQIATETIRLYPYDDGKPGYSNSHKAPPLVIGESATSRIADAIALAPDEATARNLAQIVHKCQIQDSRYSSLRKSIYNTPENEMSHSIGLSFEIVAQCDPAFRYARLRAETVDEYKVRDYNTALKEFLDSSGHPKAFEIWELESNDF